MAGRDGKLRCWCERRPCKRRLRDGRREYLEGDVNLETCIEMGELTYQREQ